MAQYLNHTWIKSFWSLLAAALMFFPSQTSSAADFQGCDSCHFETLETDRGRSYLHPPFAEQRCEECHSPLLEQESAVREVREDFSLMRPAREKTIWLADSSMAAVEHDFVLPADKLGPTLVIEARGVDGNFSRQEVAVPLLAELPEQEGSEGLPVLSDIAVLKVERGIFLSVTIGWNTDRLTDARVWYGEKEMNQSSDAMARYGRQHKVKLSNLRPDRTYRFTVASQDLFGRRQVSEPLSFSTARPLAAPAREKYRSGAGMAIVNRFRRIGSNYLVELELQPAASVFVGSMGKARAQAPVATASGQVDAPDLEPHAGLNNEIVTTITACQNCHRNENTATHPVNVYAKPGMIIPPEYPTLPDGRISCVSCHAWHSSEYEFLAFKPGKRELCIGCHRDML